MEICVHHFLCGPLVTFCCHHHKNPSSLESHRRLNKLDLTCLPRLICQQLPTPIQSFTVFTLTLPIFKFTICSYTSSLSHMVFYLLWVILQLILFPLRNSSQTPFPFRNLPLLHPSMEQWYLQSPFCLPSSIFNENYIKIAIKTI